jgi:hypothetical protein
MRLFSILLLSAFYISYLYCPVAQTMQPINQPPPVDQANAPVRTLPSSTAVVPPPTVQGNDSIPAEDLKLLEFIKTARNDPRFASILQAAEEDKEPSTNAVDLLADVIREKRAESEAELIKFIRQVVAETERSSTTPAAMQEQFLQDLAARTAQQQDQRLPGGPISKDLATPIATILPTGECANCQRRPLGPNSAYINPEFQPEFPIYTKAPVQLWDVTIVNKTGVTILVIDEVLQPGKDGKPRILHAAKTLNQGQQYIFHWYNQYTPPVARRIKVFATCQGATGAMNTISIGTTPDCTYQAIPSGTYYIIRPTACRLCIADSTNNSYCQ